MSTVDNQFLVGIFMTFGEGTLYGPKVVLLVLLAIPVVTIVLDLGVVAVVVIHKSHGVSTQPYLTN